MIKHVFLFEFKRKSAHYENLACMFHPGIRSHSWIILCFYFPDFQKKKTNISKMPNDYGNLCTRIFVYLFSVQIRESALKHAEEELRELKSRSDDKVDK